MLVVVGVDAVTLVITPDTVVVDVDRPCCAPTLPLPVAAAELHTLGTLGVTEDWDWTETRLRSWALVVGV